MKRVASFVLVGWVGASSALAACVGDSTVVPDASPTDATTEQSNLGTEGHPCYPNNTCNAGLECLSNLCVSPNTDSGGDGSDTGSTDAGVDAAAACLFTGDGSVGEVQCSIYGMCGAPGYGCCVLQTTCPSPSVAAMYCDPPDAADASPYLQCTDNGACGNGQVCCLNTPAPLTNTTDCPRTVNLPAHSTSTCFAGTNCGSNAMFCTPNGPACPSGQTCQAAYVDNEAIFPIGVCSP